MNEERKTAEVEAVGDEDGRRQLWVRAGMAVGLIGLLLGGLAVFDQQSRPPPVEEAALPTKPIAPAQVMPEAMMARSPHWKRSCSRAARLPSVMMTSEPAIDSTMPAHCTGVTGAPRASRISMIQIGVRLSSAEALMAVVSVSPT